MPRAGGEPGSLKPPPLPSWSSTSTSSAVWQQGGCAEGRQEGGRKPQLSHSRGALSACLNLPGSNHAPPWGCPSKGGTRLVLPCREVPSSCRWSPVCRVSGPRCSSIYLYGSPPSQASVVAQMVKNLLAMQEIRVPSLGLEDPLSKGMATHSSILAWRIPRTEEAGGAIVHRVVKELDTT